MPTYQEPIQPIMNSGSVNFVDPTDFSSDITYSPKDEKLLSTFDIETFLSSSSYIENFIYDLNSNLLFPRDTYVPFNNFQIHNDSPSTGLNNASKIELNPIQDIQNQFDEGTYVSYYNFLNQEIGNQNDYYH